MVSVFNVHKALELSIRVNLSASSLLGMLSPQWYPQSNEILLNLNMKCSNSAFNTQGSRPPSYNSCTGRRSVVYNVHVAWQQQWRRSGKRKDRMKLSLSPNLVEKLVWVPVVIVVPFEVRHKLNYFLICRIFGYY